MDPATLNVATMTKLRWLVTLAIMLGSGTTISGAGTDQIREIAEQKLIETKAPGAVIGVYQGDHVLAELAIGLSSIEPAEPTNIDQHFRIGSITKAFMSVILFQLVDEGRLRLDDKLSRYLPDYPDAAGIEIRQLASMTARIKDPLYAKDFKRQVESDPYRIWRADELVTATAKVSRWPAQPNDSWHYSNSAAVILGLIIERVTGNSLQHELSTRILEPLELSKTGYNLQAALPEPFCRGYSYAPERHFLARNGTAIRDVTEINPSLWNAAGGMYSTLRDLQEFASALGRGKLVSATSYAEQTNWIQTPWKNHRYGVLIAEIEGLVGHDGDVPGYCTFMGYRAHDDLTIVVLTNLHGWSVGKMPANEIASAILEIL